MSPHAGTRTAEGGRVSDVLLSSSRSRGVVQIHTRLVFQPEKVNVFNKDCLRGGVDVSCMSLSVCLSLSATTRSPPAAHVGESEAGRSRASCEDAGGGGSQMCVCTSPPTPLMSPHAFDVSLELSSDEHVLAC